MSEHTKEQLGNWFMWVFRGLTALGAFFIYQTYTEIKATRQSLDALLIDRARTDTQVGLTLRDHERRLDNIDLWKRDWDQLDRARRTREVLDATEPATN